jgi:Tfp pilus assembly protein PilF
MDSSRLSLPELPSRQTLWKIAAGFALLAALTYGTSVVRSGFVLWDDNYLIHDNVHIKSLGVSNIAYNFTHFDPELYIPLTFLSYQTDHAIAGMSPVMFHLTNVVLHWLNACMVALLLFFLVRNARAAVLCGALFLVHPLHTEAVAWASARKDLLSTFFFLGSALLYLRYRSEGSAKSYWFSVAAFALGLLAKVMIVTLPIALLLFDVLQRRTLTKKMLIDKIPYVALSCALGIVALYGKAQTTALSTTSDKVLMAAKSTVFYLQKFLVPTDLSVLYPWNHPITLSSPAFFVPLLIAAALVIGAVLSLRRTRMLFVGVAFFLLTLIPTFLNIAKGGDVYFASDRYAYLPSIGLLLILAWAAAKFLPEDGTRSGQKIVMRTTLCASVLIAVGGVLAHAQAEHWKDSESLFTRSVSVYPDAFAAHLNLSTLYRTQNRDAEALAQLEAAAKIKDHTRVESGFGTLYAKQGKLAQAEAAYRRAIQLDPTDSEPYFGLGILYAKSGKTDQAIAEYTEALARDPGYTDVRLNLAALYLDRKDFDRAREQYLQVVAHDPSYTDALFNLGVLAQDQEKWEEAAMYLERATRSDPNALDAYVRLAEIYLKLEKPDAAVHAVQEANRINPLDPDARFLLDTFRKHGLLK